MKRTWPISQVLLLGCIAVAIITVVITIVITNTTLRSVEKNLPNTLIKELVSLDQVLEYVSDVVSAAQIAAMDTSPKNFDRLAIKVQIAFKGIETLRQTYVFDNLVHASAFHAVIAPALADLQIWLSEGISGYGPRSGTTAQIILSRISISFQKARTLNQQSRLQAQDKLNEERDRLDRFLSSVNQLFMLTLFITFVMIFLFIRQYFLKIREKKAQKTLQTQKNLLNSLFENILLGITLWSRDSTFLFANKYFTQLTGYAVEDIKNSRECFTRLFPDPVYRNRVIEEWKKFTKQNDSIREFKITCKNSQVKDIEFGGTFLPDGRALFTLADITEKKALEAQYEQAQKMESLGTLAGGIAHDFNNLLSGIFGYLQLALKKTSDPQTVEYLTKAFNTSERAKGLTHQLLTFSKGGAPIKKVEPLVPFLQETARFALSGAAVSCGFKLPDDLWMCNYDKNQIGQVIDNIIINAHHAMPSGGHIQVAAVNMAVKEKEHPGLLPGKYVNISISDTGEGIPEKYISRIFDPFFTTKHKGSGLGLATSYSIIKRHGGIIEVESEPGVGTTFHIFVPAAEHHEIKEKTITEKNYKGSGRILIMDDEEMIRDMLTDMIETMGFDATVASEGRGAIEAFNDAADQNNPFRAVVLDLTVPGGMGGKETASEIRKTDKTIPVFVASGYSEDAAIADPGAFGFTASLQKPFTVEQLGRMLEKYL